MQSIKTSYILWIIGLFLALSTVFATVIVYDDFSSISWNNNKWNVTNYILETGARATYSYTNNNLLMNYTTNNGADYNYSLKTTNLYLEDKLGFNFNGTMTKTQVGACTGTNVINVSVYAVGSNGSTRLYFDGADVADVSYREFSVVRFGEYNYTYNHYKTDTAANTTVNFSTKTLGNNINLELIWQTNTAPAVCNFTVLTNLTYSNYNANNKLYEAAYDGLIAYWNFDTINLAQNTTEDNSRFYQSLLMTNITQSNNVSTPTGRGLKFNRSATGTGSIQYLTINNTQLFKFERYKDFTIEAYVNISQFGSSNPIISESTTAGGWGLYASGTSNAIGFSEFNLDGISQNSFNTHTYANNLYNVYTHIVLTNKRGNETRMYINGALVNVSPEYNTNITLMTTKLGIGGDLQYINPIYNLSFNGTIDYIKIYNRSLQPYEVVERYKGLQNYSYATVQKCLNEKNMFVSVYDEDHPTLLLDNVTIEMSGTYYFNDSWSKKNYSIYQPLVNPASACVYEDQNRTIYFNNYFMHSYPNTYQQRFYDFNNSFINPINNSLNYTLYNFNDTTGKFTVLIYVKNAINFQPLQNWLVNLSRRYIAEGVWRTERVELTDVNGLATFYVRPFDTDYNIVISDTSNKVYITTGLIRFGNDCTAGICTSTFYPNLDATTNTTTKLLYNATYNNVTGIINFTWADPELNNNKVQLIMYRLTNTDPAYRIEYAVNQTGYYGNLTGNFSGKDGTIILYYLRNNTLNYESQTLSIQLVQTKLSDFVVKEDASIWSFIILITLIGIGLTIGALATLIMLVVGLIFILYIGLFSALTVTLFALAIIGTAYVVFRQRE